MDALREMLLAKECESLILEVAWLTDHGPHNQIVDLYTLNGSFSRDGEVYVGSASLAEMYKKRPASLFTRHILSNIQVKMMSETDAIATSYATVFRYRSDDGSPPIPPVNCSSPESVSEYHDTFIKEAGVWKISSRVLKTMIQTT
jgi:hypothetical protein